MVKGLLAFVAAAGIVIAAVWVLVHLVGLKASLIWTGLVGAAAWAARTMVQRKQEYRRLLAEQKRQQYYEFLEFMNGFFTIGDEEQDPADLNDPERLRELRLWSLRLTMIGSDEVVRAWNSVRLANIASSGEDEEAARRRVVEMMRGWGKVWLEMRKDCGHFDTSLTELDMLSSVVNDINDYRHELGAGGNR